MKQTQDHAILDHVLRTSTTSPEVIRSFREWTPTWAALSVIWTRPMDRAIAAGLAADRPAWAFAGGYQAAIERLVEIAGGPTSGDTQDTSTAAVCITEQGPPHPANIKARLTPDPERPGDWILDGIKTFVSGGADVDVLWVAASTGTSPEGRNALRMARVPADLSGLRFEALPSLGIVPEIGHARVHFEAVRLGAEAVLPGDGYLRGVKPFRSLEDLYVTAAFLAWLFGVGRRGAWPRDALAELLALIASARGLSGGTALAPCVHIALGGLLAQVHGLLTRLDPLFDGLDEGLRAIWRRDRGILEIAQMARDKRFDVAWRQFEM